jgi:hypothetical protein
MVAVASQLRDWDIALMIFLLAIAMYAIPSLFEGVHKYRTGRDLARRISQEQEACDFLDRDWRERHGS